MEESDAIFLNEYKVIDEFTSIEKTSP